MRVLVAQSSLDDFDQYAVRKAWDNRWKNRLRWWFVRAKFLIKVRKIDAGAGCEKMTIALIKLDFDLWRKRNAKD